MLSAHAHSYAHAHAHVHAQPVFLKKLYRLSISTPCYIVYMLHVGDISPVCQANIVVATCQLGWLPVHAHPVLEKNCIG